MSEKKAKAEIKAFLDALGEDCWYFMPLMMGYGRKGIPDIIGGFRGQMFALEVKAPGKEMGTTNWQDMEIIAIRKAGGVCAVVTSVAEVKGVFARQMDVIQH